MKRLLCLISLILLISAVPVLAQNDISVSVKRVAGDNETIFHDVIVRITDKEPNSNVMMVVKDSNASIINIEQGYVGGDGTLSFTFRCDTRGSFNGYINTENECLKLPFTFDLISDYTDVIETFNGADESTIEDIIDSNKDSLFLDVTYYTDEVKEDVAEGVLENAGKITVSNLDDIFNKSVLDAYIYSNQETEKKIEVLEYYDALYFGIKAQAKPKNLYGDFLAFTDKQIEKVFSVIEAEDPTLDEFTDTFNESVVLVAFDMLDDSDLDTFIISNSDYVELEGYEDLTPAKRKKVIGMIKKSPAEESVSEIIDAYDEAIEELENPKTSKPSSSGGGGGGGGGMTMPIQTAPSKEDKKEPETEEKDEPESKPEVPASRFSDISGVVWAGDAINNLYKQGIINGKENGKFYPDDNVTRAEFTTMIIKALVGVDDNASCDFSDLTADDWSYKYVATGYKKGIVNGLGDNSFGKNMNITRQDMATILYRTLSFIKALPVVETIENKIPDFDDIAPYAQNSVLMLSQLGVVNGMEDGSFVPEKNATRAEAAVIIYNAMGVVEK